MIKIAVLGYGTIGSGVVEVLEINREHITQTAGQEIEVKYVLDLRDSREIRSRTRSYTIMKLSKMIRRFRSL